LAQLFVRENVYSVGLKRQSRTLAFVSSFQIEARTGLPESVA
jgi:hypothetical protein